MSVPNSPNLQAILASSTYRRAEDDPDFIKSPELRPLRLAMELMKPETVQQSKGVVSTVVVFGGTRILEPADAARRLEAAEREASLHPHDQKAQRLLAIARRRIATSRYYEEARRFGGIVTTSCQKNGDCNYVVVTGGGPGVMEAANRGAFEAGGISIGLNITLPHEQVPNAYITPELCFQFHYFAIRKMHFLLRARAMVAFPGGYGTFDELFETLTLVQTKTMERIPIILFGRDYWTKAFDVSYLVQEGTIDPEDAQLFEYAETAEEAWEIICRFYASHPAPPTGSPIHRP